MLRAGFEPIIPALHWPKFTLASECTALGHTHFTLYKRKTTGTDYFVYQFIKIT